MLKAAIHGTGRWGGRLIDSVQVSEKIRLVKGMTRNPAAHRKLAAKTGIALTESYRDVLHIEGQHSGPSGYRLKGGG